MLPLFLPVPNPVSRLQAIPKDTSSVVLEWVLPVPARSYYTYRVQILNRPNASFLSDSNTTTYLVHDLQPGTGYNFTVTTVAAQDSEASPQLVFSYTSKLSHTTTLFILYHKHIR